MHNTCRTLFFSLLITAFSSAGEWYVASGGSDTGNTGTSPGDAYATVTKAIGVAACGETIHVAAGNYTEKIIAWKECTRDNRITVTGGTGERPVITGDPAMSTRYAVSASGSGYYFNHLAFTSPYPSECSQANQVIVGSGDHFTFYDCHIYGSGYDAVKTTGDCVSGVPENWRLVKCHVYDNGLGCPASVVNGDGVDFTWVKGAVVESCVIENNMGHQMQIKLDARNVTVQDNFIKSRRHVFQIGLPGSVPGCDSTLPNADTVVIRRNVIMAVDYNEFIFKLADVAHVEISNNTIIIDSVESDTNVSFMCLGDCSSSYENYRPSTAVIRNNIFANLDAPLLGSAQYAVFDNGGIIGTDVVMDYNLFFDVNGQIALPSDGGSHSLTGDPLWVSYPDNLTPLAGSPCRDAGDPASTDDPDGTRSDIGAFYYTTSGMVMPDMSGRTEAEGSGCRLRNLNGRPVLRTGSGIYFIQRDTRIHRLLIIR